MSSTYKLDSYLGLALLEAQQGKKDSAHEHLKKALELYPDDADARAAMANFHYTNKNWVEAKAAYESVVEMSTGMSGEADVFLMYDV